MVGFVGVVRLTTESLEVLGMSASLAFDKFFNRVENSVLISFKMSVFGSKPG